MFCSVLMISIHYASFNKRNAYKPGEHNYSHSFTCIVQYESNTLVLIMRKVTINHGGMRTLDPEPDDAMLETKR